MERETSAPATAPVIGDGWIGRMSIWLADRFMRGDRTKAKEMERFLKFAVVGSVGFVVDFGTFNVLLLLLNPLFGENESLLIGVSQTLSFTAAVVNNFLWNRYWTYPDSRSKSVTGQLVQFTLVSVATWITRTILLFILQPILSNILGGILTDIGEDALVSLSASSALVIVVIIVMFLNFFINRYWTYNDV